VTSLQRVTQAGALPACRRRPVRLAVAGWAGLIALAVTFGLISEPDRRLKLGNVPPFIGHARLVPPGRWVLPAAVAGVLVAVLPVVAERWPWRRLLPASSVAAAGWAVVLATTDGWSRLWTPLQDPWEYRSTLPALRRGVGPFLETFTTALPSYSTHTQGHPPGPVLVLDGLSHLGLPGAGWEAVLVIAAGSSATAAVAIVVRRLADEATARRALPFLVLAPTALWVATSMDAFFLGVTAWGVTLLVLADRSRVVALAAGLLLGVSLYLSYALVALAPLALVAARDRARSLPVAAAGGGVVVAAFSAAGFSWPSGLTATHAAWAAGVGPIRPYGYFLLADLALLGVLVGPAGAAGLARLGDRRLWPVVGAVLLAVAVSDLGGFERGEVERIWLPFAPWLLISAAALPTPRRWLAAQAAVALAVQLVVLSLW